eukprot:3308116-Pyramimonas_sp.AAC.1
MMVIHVLRLKIKEFPMRPQARGLARSSRLRGLLRPVHRRANEEARHRFSTAGRSCRTTSARRIRALLGPVVHLATPCALGPQLDHVNAHPDTAPLAAC